MTKTWQQLTADDKIEELRRDLLKTMDVVNALSRRLDAEVSSLRTVIETLKADRKR